MIKIITTIIITIIAITTAATATETLFSAFAGYIFGTSIDLE